MRGEGGAGGVLRGDVVAPIQDRPVLEDEADLGMGGHQGAEVGGHGLAARAAEVEELDHRDLGVGGAEAGVARVRGQQGGVGGGGGVDGLDAGLLLIGLTRGQNFVQHLRVLDQIGAHAPAEIAAGQVGYGGYAQRQDRDGQSCGAQGFARQP